MPLAPTIAAALQPANPGYPWLIRVNGLDVTLAAGTAGHRIGVPIESVELELEGDGGVSSATFAIDDPDRVLTVDEGQPVEFFDAVRDVPRFAGWIQTWAVQPLGIGRQIRIEAQGREAILDWAFIPGTLTIAAGTELAAAVLAAAGAAIYPPGVALLAFGGSGGPGGPNGNANVGAGIGTFLPFVYTAFDAITITDTSLRDALKTIAAGCGTTTLAGEAIYPRVRFTVDFLGYLRAYVNTPADWEDVATAAGFGALLAPSSPSFENDAGGASHAVYVVGGNAAGTGVVVDGTGIPGPIARINDNTILSDAAKRAAAFAYMQDRSVLQRTPITLESYVPFIGTPGLLNRHVRPGAKVQLRDAQLGIDPAVQYPIGATVIRFEAGGDRENWEMSAGGRRRSAVTYLRRLTRGVKSA